MQEWDGGASGSQGSSEGQLSTGQRGGMLAHVQIDENGDKQGGKGLVLHS